MLSTTVRQDAPSGDSLAELRLLADAVTGCRQCQIAGFLERANPIRPTVLPGARVLLVGQAPGPVTDRRGYHFAGPAGRVLEGWFDRAGFPLGYFRQAVHLTSLTRCFPGKAALGNGDRPPSRAEMSLCRPFLDQEVALVQPRLVILVGKMAVDAFLPPAPLTATVGRVHERDGRLLLPLPHASGVSRWLNDSTNRALLDQALAELARLRESGLLLAT